MSFIPDPKALEKKLKAQVAKLLKKSRDVLLPILKKVNDAIVVDSVVETPAQSPYFTVQIPSDTAINGALLPEVKRIILGSGKFLLYVPNSGTEIKVSILLDNVSEFKLLSDFISPPIETSVVRVIPKSIDEDEKTLHLKAIRESTEGIPVKISQRNNFKTEIKMTAKEQELKDEITALLSAMNFNSTEHYHSIMPKGFVSMNNEGPVYFKKPEYALTVLKKCQKNNMGEFVTSSASTTLLFLPSFKNPLSAVASGGGPQVPQKSTQSKKNPKFKSEEVFAELKVFLKRLGFKMGAGFDYSTIALNTEKTFAVLNSVAEGKRQEIIDAFTKHNLFNCLELKEGKKSIRVDLVFFKNPLPASDKKDVKAPVKSTVKKSPVAKESPKGNNEDKLAELRAFIHASGIICGQHYANLTINAAKTVASINGVQAHGGALRAELIGEFNKEGLLECLDTTSTEKSIKVNLGLFKNPLIAKTEANKSQVKKVVKKVTEDKPPKKNEGLLAFTEPLNKLEKMVAKMDSLTKAMQFDPKTVWNLIKLHFAKNDDFELLVRTKIDGGEVSKVIPKEEFLKVLLK